MYILDITGSTICDTMEGKRGESGHEVIQDPRSIKEVQEYSRDVHNLFYFRILRLRNGYILNISTMTH